MIQVVFFDIDGTILPAGATEIPESTKTSLLKLHDKGIYIVISTGRSFQELQKLNIMDIPYDAFLTLNGQLCLDNHYQVLASSFFDKENLELLVGIFNAREIPFILVQKQNSYINFINDRVLDTQEETNGSVPNLGTYKGGEVYQICAFVNEHEKDLLKGVLDDCRVTSWHDEAIDIIPKDGGKENGIRSFLTAYHIPVSDSMAFGDGENDIGMLKYVGIGVAMGNSSDAVKAAADYVTTNCDEDGIQNALIHFNLID